MQRQQRLLVVPSASRRRTRRNDPLPAATTTTTTTRSRFVGKEYAIGRTIFRNERRPDRDDVGLWVIEMPDYTILSNEDFGDYAPYATTSLKRSLEPRWRYSMHVSPSVEIEAISRHVLHSRIVGGQILAYKYLECSIEGNQCVYYGFVPTIERDALTGTHRRCRFSMQAVYPRKFFVYFERDRVCPCNDASIRDDVYSDDDDDDDECSSDSDSNDGLERRERRRQRRRRRRRCFKWTSRSLDGDKIITFCGRDVPWSRVYVMMGDADESFAEILKPPRDCHVCAQCFECSRGAAYCRRHLVCRHKQARPMNADDSSSASSSSSSTASSSSKRQSEKRRRRRERLERLMSRARIRTCKRVL